MEELIERIKMVYNEFSDSKSESAFARELGVNQTLVNYYLSGKRKVSIQFVMQILESYPDLSAEWLLRGVGNMKIGDVVEVQEKNKSIVEDLKIRISSLEKKVLELENTNKKLEEDKAELRVDKDDFRREKNEYKTKLEEALEKLKTVQSMAQSQMVFSAGDTTIETMELKNHVVNH